MTHCSRCFGISTIAANVYDTKSGVVVFKRAFEKYLSIKKFCADAARRVAFINNVQNQVVLSVDVFGRIKPCSWQKTLARSC